MGPRASLGGQQVRNDRRVGPTVWKSGPVVGPNGEGGQQEKNDRRVGPGPWKSGPTAGLNGESFKTATSFREVLLKNISWSVVSGAEVRRLGGRSVICFPQEDLAARTTELKSCLVGRAIGDNPSSQVLRLSGKDGMEGWECATGLQTYKGVFSISFPFEIRGSMGGE